MNGTNLIEKVEDVLLRNGLVNVLDDQVTLLVGGHFLLVWHDSNGLTTDVMVVHLLHALVSFLLVVESKVAVALKLELLVKHYLSGLQFVALGCENLVEV